MKKISLTSPSKGIFYVEVREANLRILCGAPADAVKTLISKGIVRWTEKNGVKFETGPNAILLSDIPVQNGNPSNLTEFPIMQMLYRQGMIIPNHPNNNGEIPILIGSASELISQLDYIYFGNYGVDSVKELEEQGLRRHEAEELLRMKKKFAFGNFRSTREFLREVSVDSQYAEILNGVRIRRLESNVFELAYEDETTTVDLNLAEKEVYERVYPLGNFNFKRNHFSIVHSGEGDGWDTSRPCMSSVMVHQGKIFLLDTGPNTASSLMALGIGINEIAGLYLTHLHDDHFSGISCLMDRFSRLPVYTTPLIRHGFIKKISVLFSVSRQVVRHFFDFVDLKPGEWNLFHNMEIKPVLSPHPIETYNFVFRCLSEQGYKTYAHLADVTSFKVMENMVEEDASKPGISRKLLEETQRHYLTPVTLKKVDVGGGMIHGDPFDFASDTSDKLVLAHTSTPISDPKVLSIGSGAGFGSVDVLVEGHFDYLREIARDSIEKNFPGISKDSLLQLLDSKIDSIYPFSRIANKGGRIHHVHVILTGSVSCFDPESLFSSQIGFGEMIGNSVIYEPSDEKHKMDFQTQSYVNLLSIPAEVVKSVIEKSGLRKPLAIEAKKIELMRSLVFFKKKLESHKLTAIADQSEIIRIRPGEIDAESLNEMIHRHVEKRRLMFVLKGKITKEIAGMGEKPSPILQGEYFGTNVIYRMLPNYFYDFDQEALLCSIPFEAIKNIPYVYLEIYEKNKKNLNVFINRIRKAKNDSYVHFPDDSYLDGFEEINFFNKNLLVFLNAFGYFFQIKSPLFVKISLKNLSTFFTFYSDVKQSHLLAYEKGNFKLIRQEYKETIRFLDALIEKCEAGESVTQPERDELERLLLNRIAETK